MSSTVVRPTAQRTIVLRKWHLAVAIGALLLVGALLYSRDRKMVEVRAEKPVVADIESTVTTDGPVTPVKDYPARANFSGIVEHIYVHLGDKVRAGQQLLEMKDQYAQSRIDVARANLDDSIVNAENVQHNGSKEDRIGFAADMVRTKAEQQSAEAALATLKKLAQDGSVSEAEVIAGQQRLDAANAAMEALQKRTTDRYSDKDIISWKDRVAANRANLAAEKVSYGNAHIVSPIAGTVYMLPIAQYDFVNAGSDLLDVADLSKVHIRANFDEADIARLHVGEKANISWDGKPNQVWHGHIAAKPLAVSRQGDRSVGQCMIDIDDARGDLPIDVNVSITVTIDKHAHVLTLPREALHTDGPDHFVYRVDGGELRKTRVGLGIANAMRVEITKGISPDDMIALHALDDTKLKDKLDVSVSK